MQLPVIFTFTFIYWVSESGLHSQGLPIYLRESVQPLIIRAVHGFTDLKFYARGTRPPRNKIVVVEIDSPSLDSLGRWPWHRDVTANLLDRILTSGAKVVGMDMVFSERDVRLPEKLKDEIGSKQWNHLAKEFETDFLLEKVIKKYSDRLVLGWTSDLSCQPLYDPPAFCPVQDPEALKTFRELSHFRVDSVLGLDQFRANQTPIVSFVTPISNLPEYDQAAQQTGYFNVVLDPDGSIRRTNLIAMGGGKPYPSLALEMARVGLRDKLQVEFDKEGQVRKIAFASSPSEIRVSPWGVMNINFRGPSSVFTHISAEQILTDQPILDDPSHPSWKGLSKREILQEVFKDAYVLVGVSAIGVFDMRHFPFESNAPGVYGHAHILDSILSGDALITDRGGYGSILIYLVMTLGMLGFSLWMERLEAIPALLACIVLLALIYVLDFRVLFFRNMDWNTAYLYVEIGVLCATSFILKYIDEEQKKKFIRGAFSKYVATEVVNSILKDKSKLALGGEKRELSVLFSDIREFTSFSENLDAKVLSAFLNDYFNIMTDVILRHQGTLDKFIGDAIMAFWGAPLHRTDHAVLACRAGVEMVELLKKNRARFKQQYGVDVFIGVGVNSGVMSVGNMGSEKSFAYTVIGDHVNLASRVESLTKKYGAEVLTTRFTLEAMSEVERKSISFRTIDRVRVKGRKNIVELIQLFSQPPSDVARELFEQGLRFYWDQRWKEAQAKFRAAEDQFKKEKGSGDPLCDLFLSRCADFERNPPPVGWDGSWDMSDK